MVLGICAALQAREPGGDVIIVGGGLAGLAAADALRDLDLLLLERAPDLGGRVLTRHRKGITWELGALSPPDLRGLPGFAPELLDGPHGLGVSLGGRTILGADMDQVAAALPGGGALMDFAKGAMDDPAALTGPARGVLEATTRLFFLCDLAETPVPLARRSLQARLGRTFARGYRSLIDHLGRGLEGRLLTGAEVLHVRAETSGVRVLWRRGGCEHESLTRAVILATEPTAVPRLLDDLRGPARAGLSAQGSAAGISVAIGVRQLSWPEVSMILVLGKRAHAVVRHPGPPQDGVTVLYVYYGDAASRELEISSDQDVLADALSTLRNLGLGPLTDDQLAFQELHRWPHAIPAQVPGMSRPPWDRRARAHDRIWLAGDHVGAPGKDGCGADAAIASGRAAAAAVRSSGDGLVQHRPPSAAFGGTSPNKGGGFSRDQ